MADVPSGPSLDSTPHYAKKKNVPPLMSETKFHTHKELQVSLKGALMNEILQRVFTKIYLDYNKYSYGLATYILYRE
jgi:hypothetical protein